MSRGRTGAGITRLRTRFVRRATFLSRDRDFLQGIKAARLRWEGDFPAFRIQSDRDRWSYPPPSLLQAVSDETAQECELMAGEDKDDWIISGPYAARLALDHWNRLITRIALYYWPRLDFPHPFPPDRHPARAFVAASLFLTDPYDRISHSDVEWLFPSFVLEPEPMTAVRGELATDGLGPDDDVGWCLPLYPGLTANDLETAARDVAERVRQLYKGQDADDRMMALRTEGAGMTHQQIADRLGIDVKTVAARLIGIPQGEKKES